MAQRKVSQLPYRIQLRDVRSYWICIYVVCGPCERLEKGRRADPLYRCRPRPLMSQQAGVHNKRREGGTLAASNGKSSARAGTDQKRADWPCTVHQCQVIELVRA